MHLHIVANGFDPGKAEWASIGIVVSKLCPQTVDKKGNKFTIFTLTNLRDIPKTVKIMAFGEVHKRHWKTQIGATVLFTNPKMMPKKTESKYENVPTVTLNGPEEFTVLGFAADLGTCTSKTKVGNKCPNFVNLSVSQMCPTHMLQQFNRATSQRGEFSARTGNIRLGDKYKGTMWEKVKGENFFGGGKTFQALPPSMNPSCNKSAKLNFIANSNAKASATAKEMIKNPNIMVKSGTGMKNTGRNISAPEETSAMVRSSNHGGRLLAAAIGKSSENISLKKSKDLKKPDSKTASITASQLLKQKNEEFLAQKRQAMKQRKLEAALAQEKRNNSLSSNDKPGLVLTGTPGKSMFSHLAQSNEVKMTKERAKIKAAAILKAQMTKSPDEKKKQILARVQSNIVKNKGNNQAENEKQKEFMGKKLGQLDVKDVFKKKSRHHETVENLISAEQDLYFSILEKKEEMASKMEGVMQAESQVVTCKECKYTFWSAHENCKKQNHDLKWSKVTKRWFKCKNCPTQRAVTFDKYPKHSCSSCGRGTHWMRCSAGDTNKKAPTEASKLLIRGEERKWANQ